MRARLGPLLMAAAFLLAAVPGAAGAGTVPGSSETLVLTASGERGVGKELKITAEGAADGAHRLYVLGETAGCPGWLGGETPTETLALTPPGGETLSAGHFSRTFDVVPRRGTTYGVCAFLSTGLSALPDVWGSGCFSLDGEPDCRYPELDPYGVLAAEEMGRRIVAEEEQQRAEREVHERAGAEQAAREQGERDAREAARCHVPRLLGQTLSTARHLLAAAHCRLGIVKPKHRPKRRLRVRWQRPGKGGSYPAGTAVAVLVGR